MADFKISDSIDKKYEEEGLIKKKDRLKLER